MNKYQKVAIIAAAMITVLLSSIGMAAYYEKVTLKGSVSLLIPYPTPSPSPSPIPSDTSNYWIQVARDALQRAIADDAHATELMDLAYQAMNGSQSTNAAYGGLSPYWSMAENAEQLSWVQDTNSQIGAFHQIAVNAYSSIAQISGSMDKWQTDKYVNGWHTAEYEYDQCQQTNDAPGHLEKLKTYALNAKTQADADDAMIVTAQTHLATAQKAASDAWQAIEDLRLKLLAASQASTPAPTAVIPTAAPSPSLSAVIPTAAPSPPPMAVIPTAALSPSPTAVAPTSVPSPSPIAAAPSPSPAAVTPTAALSP
jgi:hypothetical protein